MADRFRPTSIVHALAACLLLVTGFGTATAAAEKRVQFNIAAQDLASALNEFARQSDQELMFSSELATAKRTSGVVGEFAPYDALKALLQGTGLRYRITRKNTILIEKADPETAMRMDGGVAPFMTPMMAMQAIPSFRAAEEPEGDAQESSNASSTEPNAARLGEMMVTTGSHIPGAESVSQVFIYSQKDFEIAGAATVPQFLATLPQNFGGGMSEDTTNIPTPGGFNASFGTGINLRGLGSSSTLILINGRRSASAGQANFVDVSMIPLSAVERIEVLTDGASAIYGSDAIGGVVNFIMRDDYEGGQTRLRTGATTHDDGAEHQVAQSLGGRWESGSVLASYEYYQRGSVSSTDRDFASGAAGPIDFVPEQESHSAYLSAHQDLNDRISLFADAIYATRDARYLEFDQFAIEMVDTLADTQQYGGSLGIAIGFGDSWTLEVSGDAGVNEIEQIIRSPSQNGGIGDILYESEYELRSANLLLTGSLFEMPSGAAKLAVGAAHREESFVFADSAGGIPLVAPPEEKLSASSAFFELSLPLLRERSEETNLLLTLAGRYEDYDSFGSTFDPKIGIRWAPLDALALRATYGTSFKAPNVYQINAYNANAGINNRADPQSPTGVTRAITRTGNNPTLVEETADTWTIGAILAPLAMPGFRSELTYFDIDFRDRIQAPGVTSVTALSNPIYADLALRRGEIPDPDFDALVEDLLSGRSNSVRGCGVPSDPVTGACPEPASNINAIIDLRLVNIAVSRVSGIDWTVAQRIDGSAGVFEISLNASYLLRLDQQITELAPALELVDTANNPVDLRARASVGWMRNGWGVTGTINYTDKYTDNVGEPEAQIDAWTTLDLNLRYETADRFNSSWLDGVVVSFNVVNALDEDPPFFADDSVLLGYDPTNADPLGRVVSLTVVKEW